MILQADLDKTLIRLRISQAIESVEEVELLIKNQMYRAASNRIYYGMFYALLALAVKYKFKTSKHRQLIGWFNRTFIKNDLINKKFGKIITTAFELRKEGDYIAFTQFDAEEVYQNLNDMKDFIREIESYISSNE
jgi:uncharacterized protein (UPF0332 family)